MSWNEPNNRDNRDDRDKSRDPWRRRDEDMPPNIDEALKQFQRKIKGLFGSPSGGSRIAPVPRFSWNKSAIAAVILALYLCSGFYIVGPADEAVVLRFGRFQRTEGSGVHWIMPIVETRKIVNIQEVKTVEEGGQTLTKDENIVSVKIAVQYRIDDPKYYLFSVENPEQTLRQVSESALRSVVGESTLNEVLTEGRSDIGMKIRKLVQQNLDHYKTGIEISDLAMQQTKAPEEVKKAFDDAIRAQQDEERSVNEAEAYSRKVFPIAEGQAKRTLEEARAYREKVTMQAQGQTAQFAQILPEYRRAPQVTRDRMYMDALQEVYTKTPKILVDVAGGNNVIYLPVDQLQRASSAKGTTDNTKQNSTLSMMDSASEGASRSNAERPDYDYTDRPVTREGE